MKASEILKCAVTHLEKRGGWTQFAFAKNKEGDSCGEDVGVSFCSVGALKRCARYDYPEVDYEERLNAEFDARDYLGKIVDPTSGDVITWNDTEGREKRQVIAAFKKAIKAAEAAEAEAATA